MKNTKGGQVVFILSEREEKKGHAEAVAGISMT